MLNFWSIIACFSVVFWNFWFIAAYTRKPFTITYYEKLLLNYIVNSFHIASRKISEKKVPCFLFPLRAIAIFHKAKYCCKFQKCRPEICRSIVYETMRNSIAKLIIRISKTTSNVLLFGKNARKVFQSMASVNSHESEANFVPKAV